MAAPMLDVLIIGAGPAGLAATLALARHLRTVAVFSNGLFRNKLSKHMHMVPTWDHRDSVDFRAATREEILGRYDTIQFEDVAIESIKKQDDGTFEAVDANQKRWLGRKVLLAHGIRDIMPEEEFPGYTENWTKGIFHCLFCHGYEERGAPSVGVLAWGLLSPEHAVGVSRMARNLGQSVVIYTHGNEETAKAVEKGGPGPRISIDSRKIQRLEKMPEGSEITIHFADGSSKTEGFLAHMPSGELSAQFANQLGCEMNNPWSIKVGAPFPETTVKGVFAAGDIATFAPAVMSALYTGQFAGVGLVQSLAADVKA